jgi:hypothetical protein
MAEAFEIWDRNGETHDCVAESFSTAHQVLILTHSVETLTAARVLLAAAGA